MAVSNQELLNQELSTRLALQISVSSLPFIEEWVDAHLARWLESIPMPTEMPMGHTASFLATLGAGLERVRWNAHGHPDGFVPSLIRYLKGEVVSHKDLQLLDTMGNQLEPKLVGSWIDVEGNDVTKGWYFFGDMPFSELMPALGETDGSRLLIDWLSEMKISEFRRITQCVSDPGFTEIEFAIPGVAIDDQLNKLAKGFESLGGSPLPDPVKRDFASAMEPDFSIAVRFIDGTVTRVVAIAPSLGADVITSLCRDLEVTYESKATDIMRALKAGAFERVSYFWSKDEQGVDLSIGPGTGGEEDAKRANAN